MNRKYLTPIFILTLIGIFWLLRDSLFALILFGLLALLVYMIMRQFSKPKPEELPGLSKEKEAHYQTTGMSDAEIKFFRETMNTTKQQIQQLQKNINSVSKLKAIDLRNDTLRTSKALFKELVKEPDKLHKANHFLYTHLPNLVELTDKYVEISNHEIKNKQTYVKLDESAQIIDQMSKLIIQDYQSLVADDLDELDVEISIAKNSLKGDNKE